MTQTNTFFFFKKKRGYFKTYCAKALVEYAMGQRCVFKIENDGRTKNIIIRVFKINLTVANIQPAAYWSYDHRQISVKSEARQL